MAAVVVLGYPAMAVDFARKGLLDGLEGDARAARLELLERLEAEGATLEEMRDAVRDGLLVFLLAERLVDGPPRHRMRDVADAAGVPLELLVALRRANGLPVPDPDAIALTDLDVEAMRTAAAFRDAGVSDEQMMGVVRVLGRGMAQAAETMRTIGLELALEPGTSEAELARRFAERSAALVPMLGPMLEQMLRLHLRHAVGTEALGADERAAGVLPTAREVGVAFADLVGFTRLGEELPPEELGAVAERLEALAGDLAEPPVRLVKTIGDAAMLVSPDVVALLDCALDLHDGAAGEGDDFPALRIGVARGPAVARAGDWYGRPVNLASRITAAARPGSVLADRAVRDAARERYRWSAAGRRSLRGVDGPVALYRARRAEPDANA
jgi:adenylate cyclase